MNAENIRALAALLRTPEVEKHFSMFDFFVSGGHPVLQPEEVGAARGFVTHCGTTACIAGWEAARIGHVFSEDETYFDVARASLGIGPRTADALFVPGTVDDWSLITPKIAADVLDRLANTGRVRWPQSVRGPQ